MRSTQRNGRALLAAAVSALFISTVAYADVDSQRLLNSDKEPGNWMSYHGGYKSWHYSALDQINTRNVSKLQEAWSHVASRVNRGLQGYPLAIDGVLYYSSPYNQVYALDGATGQIIWTFKQKLDEDLVARQTHSPYNRGIAAGYGNIYMGTLDGKLVAIDMKTGKLNWETPLIDSARLTVGFTGAPLLVKNTVVIGSQGGEWPYRGPIFGVNAQTGKMTWQFYTVAGNEGTPTDRRNTWGGDSWKTGGGGGWMAGSYDPETDTVWWGTGNPAPLYDWAGDQWKTMGPRPGDNLYTSSIILLNPDTGELKGFHQVLPHDAWDYDPASGELMMIEQGGKKYVVHPTKAGFVFVFDRQGKPVDGGGRFVRGAGVCAHWPETPIPASGAVVLGRVIQTGRPQFSGNWTDAGPGGSAYAYAAVLPILREQGVVAALVLVGHARDPFTALDDSFLLALGHQVGAALENADLYGRLEARTIELARLSARMIEQHEEERRRLSRELHDETAQVFSAVKMELGVLRDTAQPGEAARLDHVLALIDTGIRSIRSVTNDLRPSLLDDLGLLPALRSLVADFGERSGIRTGLAVPTALPPLSGEAELALFRALQEALSNVLRHANARTVDIGISINGQGVLLQVSDDGRGLPTGVVPEALELQGHMGLAGMRERITALGGTVRLRGRTGAGALLEVLVPAPDTARS